MPAVPAKTAYLSCDLTQKFTLTALLCLLVPAQIQLALRTGHYYSTVSLVQAAALFDSGPVGPAWQLISRER